MCSRAPYLGHGAFLDRVPVSWHAGQGGFLDFRSAVARQASLDRGDACLCNLVRSNRIEDLARYEMLNGDEREPENLGPTEHGRYSNQRGSPCGG